MRACCNVMRRTISCILWERNCARRTGKLRGERARVARGRGRSAAYNIDMFNDTAARDNGLVNNKMWKLLMLQSEITVASCVESLQYEGGKENDVRYW